MKSLFFLKITLFFILIPFCLTKILWSFKEYLKTPKEYGCKQTPFSQKDIYGIDELPQGLIGSNEITLTFWYALSSNRPVDPQNFLRGLLGGIIKTDKINYAQIDSIRPFTIRAAWEANQICFDFHGPYAPYFPNNNWIPICFNTISENWYFFQFSVDYQNHQSSVGIYDSSTAYIYNDSTLVNRPSPPFSETSTLYIGTWFQYDITEGDACGKISNVLVTPNFFDFAKQSSYLIYGYTPRLELYYSFYESGGNIVNDKNGMIIATLNPGNFKPYWTDDNQDGIIFGENSQLISNAVKPLTVIVIIDLWFKINVNSNNMLLFAKKQSQNTLFGLWITDQRLSLYLNNQRCSSSIYLDRKTYNAILALAISNPVVYQILIDQKIQINETCSNEILMPQSSNDYFIIGSNSLSQALFGNVYSFRVFSGSGFFLKDCSLSNCELCLGVINPYCLVYKKPNKCEFGYYVSNRTNLCQKCHYGCEACFGGKISTCTKCSDGYYLENTECKLCHSNCNACIGDGENMCIECSEGTYSMSSNKLVQSCVKTCPNGYYSDEISRNCLRLIAGNVNNPCIECLEGYYFNTIQNLFEECPTGCQSCSSIYQCKECFDQYNWLALEKSCLKACPIGYQTAPCISTVSTICCQEICGDGIRIFDKCDDGNKYDGDGCSSTCNLEDGFISTNSSSLPIQFGKDFAQYRLPYHNAEAIEITFSSEILNLDKNYKNILSIDLIILLDKAEYRIQYVNNKTILLVFNYKISFQDITLIILFNKTILMNEYNQILNIDNLAILLPYYYYYSELEQSIIDNSIFASSIVGYASLSTFVGMNLLAMTTNFLYSVISSMQIIYLLLFIDIQYPTNFADVIQKFDIISYSFLPNFIGYYAYQYGYISDTIPPRLQNNNMNYIFLINIGRILLFFCLFIIIHVLIALLKKIFGLHRFSLFNRIYNSFTLQCYFKYLCINLYQVNMMIWIQINNINYENLLTSISTILSILMLIIILNISNQAIYSRNEDCAYHIEELGENSIKTLNFIKMNLYPFFIICFNGVIAIVIILFIQIASLLIIIFKKSAKKYRRSLLSPELFTTLIIAICMIWVLNDRFNWLDINHKMMLGWAAILILSIDFLINTLMKAYENTPKLKKLFKSLLKKKSRFN